jgi:hypothetical protein
LGCWWLCAGVLIQVLVMLLLVVGCWCRWLGGGAGR